MNRVGGFSCLLLAAGKSSRMGDLNKLLIPVGGKTLLGRALAELSMIPFIEWVTVTGHEAVAIETEIKKMPEGFRSLIVHNADFGRGMHSSIRCGLGALRKDCDAFFICLADQPLFSHLTLLELQKAFWLGEKKLLAPTFAGQRGHPVLIDAQYIDEILAHADSDQGCQYLFKQHPTEVELVPMADEASLLDIDSPADWVDFEKRGAAGAN